MGTVPKLVVEKGRVYTASPIYLAKTGTVDDFKNEGETGRLYDGYVFDFNYIGVPTAPEESYPTTVGEDGVVYPVVTLPPVTVMAEPQFGTQGWYAQRPNRYNPYLPLENQSRQAQSDYVSGRTGRAMGKAAPMVGATLAGAAAFPYLAAGVLNLPYSSLLRFIGNPASTVADGLNFGSKAKTIAGGIDNLYNSYLTVDGLHNLFTDNGVQKTYRLAKEGDAWGAVKSGAGDILDLAGGKSVIDKFRIKGANALYNNVTPVSYSSHGNEIKDAIKDFLFTPSWKLNKVRSPEYFPRSYVQNRDFAYRSWLGLPQRSSSLEFYQEVPDAHRSFYKPYFKEGNRYRNLTLNDAALLLLDDDGYYKEYIRDINGYNKFLDDIKMNEELIRKQMYSSLDLKSLIDKRRDTKIQGGDYMLNSHGAVNLFNQPVGSPNVFNSPEIQVHVMQDVWDINPLDYTIYSSLRKIRPKTKLGNKLRDEAFEWNRNFDLGFLFPNSKKINVVYPLFRFFND